MGIINEFADKFRNIDQETGEPVVETTGFKGFLNKTKKVIGIIVAICYRLRKVVLAVPVGYYALKLAAYNMANLPDTVGLILESDGTFMLEFAKSLAVIGPLGVTAGCLVMMFLARKALYPWAVSVFSLLLPILVLFSNLYPA